MPRLASWDWEALSSRPPAGTTTDGGYREDLGLKGRNPLRISVGTDHPMQRSPHLHRPCGRSIIMTGTVLSAATRVGSAPFTQVVVPRTVRTAACPLPQISAFCPTHAHFDSGMKFRSSGARMQQPRAPRRSISREAFSPESYDVVDEVSNVPLYVAAVAGVVVGLGAPILYEVMGKKSDERENEKPCFPCDGTGRLRCRVCEGKGKVEIDIGGDELEVNNCVNCDGSGQITCTTCQGNGIQPRYLERREFVDND